MKRIILFSLFLPSFVFGHDLESAFIKLAKQVSPSVVNISLKKEEQPDVMQFLPGYFIPFNRPPVTASGSGFIVDEEGLIVTNSHVVHEGFDQIQVQFAGDDKSYSAKVLGRDSHSDIALLKVDVKKKLIPFKMGDSEKLQVGEWVVAIGNPHGLEHTMTKGIISAVNRDLDDLNLFPLLQTDAGINPGNSGGPLINLKGEVVGVNQAIVRGATGIGFAIPINNVKEVLKDLKSYGFVRRSFIGIQYYKDYNEGVVIRKIVPGSPAEKAGLKMDDRIIEFAGTKIKKLTDLSKAVRKTPVGKNVTVIVLRGRGDARISINIQPKMAKKDSFSSFEVQPSQKDSKMKGQNVSGGFKVAKASPEYLKLLNQPDLGARYPLVISIEKNTPAFKAGLRVGDLIFRINNKTMSKLADVSQTLKKGENLLKVLRYHPRYDQYLLTSLRLVL